MYKRQIIDNAKDYPINPPAEKKQRIERLYDLTRMVYADNIADDEEKELLKRIVVGLGFAIDEAHTIVEKALDIIQNGSDEDTFVEAFF